MGEVFWMWIGTVTLQKKLSTCNLSEKDKKLFSENKMSFSPLSLFKSVFADKKVWHPWSSHKHLSSFEDFDKLDFKRDRSIHTLLTAEDVWFFCDLYLQFMAPTIFVWNALFWGCLKTVWQCRFWDNWGQMTFEVEFWGCDLKFF